ncbi:uncharacterized protein FFM5_15351 [Fusarium fujikuroi]|nr:uncharacterized protein FFM5_15351 [Fusarium fujikuroi]
MLYIRYI